jgi:hypothetical protein
VVLLCNRMSVCARYANDVAGYVGGSRRGTPRLANRWGQHLAIHVMPRQVRQTWAETRLRCPAPYSGGSLGPLGASLTQTFADTLGIRHGQAHTLSIGFSNASCPRVRTTVFESTRRQRANLSRVDVAFVE